VEVFSTLQYVFMAWCLVKHGNNFTYRNFECQVKVKGKGKVVPVLN